MADADSLKSSLSILSAVQRQFGFVVPSSLWNCLLWGKSCQIGGTFEGLSLSLAFDIPGYTVLSKKHSLSMRDVTFSDPFNLSTVSLQPLSPPVLPAILSPTDSVLLGSFLGPPLHTNTLSSLASMAILRTVVCHRTLVHVFPETRTSIYNQHLCWFILDEDLM